MPAISLFRNEPGHRELSTGDVLFEAGDPASHVYGVVSGEIEIVVIAEVDEARFLALVKMNPFFALEMMREMAERFERQQRPS